MHVWEKQTGLCSMALALLLFCIGGQLHAGMLSTEQVLSTSTIAADKQTVRTGLARESVRQALLEHGVKPEMVEARLDQLTDTEIHELAQKFDELPAAAGVGVVLLAAGIAILIIEYLGFTDLTTTF